jgi:hypothetical protein
VTGALFALTLGTAAELWAGTKGFDQAACDSAALASAIRAQRPSAAVHPWDPDARDASPGGRAIRVRVVRGGGATHLDVTGAGAAISRVLPPVDDCKRDVEIAALIVDNALDELRVSEAPEVGSLAAPVPLRSRLEVGAAIGGGIEQGPFGVVAAVDVGAVARYRFVELTLDADVGLPSSSTLPNAPEAGSDSVAATSLGLELGIGLAPRIGPGRASVDALLGLSVTFATASAATPTAALFRPGSQTVSEGFGGLRLGYVLDLPHSFYVGARVEERFAPAQTDFGVAGDSREFTRTWTFDGLFLLGYRFL